LKSFESGDLKNFDMVASVASLKAASLHQIDQSGSSVSKSKKNVDFSQSYDDLEERDDLSEN